MKFRETHIRAMAMAFGRPKVVAIAIAAWLVVRADELREFEFRTPPDQNKDRDKLEKIGGIILGDYAPSLRYSVGSATIGLLSHPTNGPFFEGFDVFVGMRDGDVKVFKEEISDHA